jgi:hypothetical protein
MMKRLAMAVILLFVKSTACRCHVSKVPQCKRFTKQVSAQITGACMDSFESDVFAFFDADEFAPPPDFSDSLHPPSSVGGSVDASQIRLACGWQTDSDDDMAPLAAHQSEPAVASAWADSDDDAEEEPGSLVSDVLEQMRSLPKPKGRPKKIKCGDVMDAILSSNSHSQARNSKLESDSASAVPAGSSRSVGLITDEECATMTEFKRVAATILDARVYSNKRHKALSAIDVSSVALAAASDRRRVPDNCMVVEFRFCIFV